MSLLITPTLLDSYDWLMKAPESVKKGTDITWKQDAFEQLKATLTRAPWRPPLAVIKGMEFEKLVCKHANEDIDDLKASEHFKKVCRKIAGYKYQVVTKKYVAIDGKEYVLYGKMDARKPNHIIDIKTTGNYRGQNSYLTKWQHKFYTLSEGIKNFEYVIAEWMDAETNDYTIKDVHEIKYIAEDFGSIQKEIEGHIKLFIEFLESKGNEELREGYYHKFNRF